MWPKIEQVTEEMVKIVLQLLLDANTPIVLLSLKLARFNLGTILPKIMGVRFYQTEERILGSLGRGATMDRRPRHQSEGVRPRARQHRGSGAAHLHRAAHRAAGPQVCLPVVELA